LGAQIGATRNVSGKVDVIDELKGQASEKEPALCVSLANQAILIVDTKNSLLP
jgi:hypothetical protein